MKTTKRAQLGSIFLLSLGLLLLAAMPGMAKNIPPLRPRAAANAPMQAEWGNLTPSGWFSAAPLKAGAWISHSRALSLTAAWYTVSGDDGHTWSAWAKASATGTISSTAFISAALTFSDGVTNRVRFAIGEQNAGSLLLPPPATGTVHFSGYQLSPSYTVRVDTAPPTATILSPSTGALITETQNNLLLFNGQAGDATSGVDRVEVSVDSGNTWQTAVGADAWQYNWDIGSVGNGLYTVYARAVDAAGNVQSPGVSATIKISLTRRIFLPVVLKAEPNDACEFNNDCEPNNKRSEAYPVKSGKTYVSHIASSADIWDCFYFEPAAQGQMVATLTDIPPHVDYDLYLYASATSSDYAARSARTGSVDEQIVYNLTHTGRHYICVYQFDGWSNSDSYLLTVTYP